MQRVSFTLWQRSNYIESEEGHPRIERKHPHIVAFEGLEMKSLEDTVGTIAARRTTLWHEGEKFAAATLEAKGWSIIERNWKAGRYEVDIIALTPEDLLVFVEVKTRITAREPGVAMYGLESITHTKRQKLVVAATIYLHNNNLVERGARLDVLVVSFRKKETATPIKLEEYENMDSDRLMRSLDEPVATHIEEAFY